MVQYTKEITATDEDCRILYERYFGDLSRSLDSQSMLSNVVYLLGFERTQQELDKLHNDGSRKLDPTDLKEFNLFDTNLRTANYLYTVLDRKKKKSLSAEESFRLGFQQSILENT